MVFLRGEHSLSPFFFIRLHSSFPPSERCGYTDIVIICFSGWGWVRVAVDEPSDEPLRKGETQRIEPSTLNLCTSVGCRAGTKCNFLSWLGLYIHVSPGLAMTYGGCASASG